ncbi:porin family protein [Chryseobacterium koreense]|uniref:porin family protein n=1 Tax=Chryseobacterium koreense TaxID=232216 RepID=UPI0026ECB5C7|nr:porin family protein [Chryseobacterium koreense]
MKKILVGSWLFASVCLFAQIDVRNTRFGLTAGATYSRISNAHNPSGPRYSFYAGALAQIPIGQNDQFYLQPEVEFLGAGETGKDKNAQSSKGYDAVYANNYISVPIYFKAYLSEAESEFFAIAGPKFNILIDQKVTDPSKPYYAVDQLPEYPGVNGKAASLNFALSVGLGYSLKRQLELTARYDIGLSNTYKGLMSEPGSDPNIAKGKSEQVLSVGLSYIFH